MKYIIAATLAFALFGCGGDGSTSPAKHCSVGNGVITEIDDTGNETTHSFMPNQCNNLVGITYLKPQGFSEATYVDESKNLSTLYTLIIETDIADPSYKRDLWSKKVTGNGKFEGQKYDLTKYFYAENDNKIVVAYKFNGANIVPDFNIDKGTPEFEALMKDFSIERHTSKYKAAVKELKVEDHCSYGNVVNFKINEDGAKTTDYGPGDKCYGIKTIEMKLDVGSKSTQLSVTYNHGFDTGATATNADVIVIEGQDLTLNELSILFNYDDKDIAYGRATPNLPLTKTLTYKGAAHGEVSSVFQDQAEYKQIMAIFNIEKRLKEVRTSQLHATKLGDVSPIE